ncbi:hypothetical protein OEV82_02470 [Caldibacillus thermolactis]|jgi:hypothetical protein|uniref:Uncharacterized protein n=1 Tax=Pallidibacillus thermolactis TaxID=251051 RepID=A0ABT2WCB6_9BACI|nr:hypothetical protein [Pallidibacillus thermolactis]MCU9593320.1 hypothetical protein [Pallidibacillus thermolactis]MCU9601941.1 hypothetical protein [Pallidibacillus thermolactis subsp. kokeshiiformis]MED1674180.1 hypothetical protein [Pallidibacillus thermolactis subsp. kokeshiiformis]
MFNKLKSLPKQVNILVGICLILLSGIFPFDSWSGMFLRGSILFVAILFIVAAAEKNKAE